MFSQFTEGLTNFKAVSRADQFGQDVAEAVYVWEQTDASGHNAFLNPQPTNYIPPAGSGLWHPTAPDFSSALFPSWGNVRTFALAQNELLAAAPIPYGEDPNSPFFAQMWEVQNTVNSIKDPPPGLVGWAADQQWMGEFWSDDNPYVTFSPGTRWVSIADQMVANESLG